jgi:AraC family transcriptional regulator, regulatory protein of adaptative response / methylphosphotriester-DNA alkyltransferase methyltransferase
MQQEQWEAIVNCDDTYDGTFFYAVTTTGIYCRPSCKSRTPKPANVKIFKNREEALAVGFRACKRCRPDQLNGPDAELAQRVVELLESRFAEPWTLASIAEELHVSPFHLHRLFKRVTGKTPADSLLETRLTVAKGLLSGSDDKITDIACSVGFANMAHFSSVFQKHVGMSPTAYRRNSHSTTP